MAYTYGKLIRDLANADPRLPVRVKLANGQTREVESAEVEFEVTIEDRPEEIRGASGAAEAGVYGLAETHKATVATISLASE